MADRAGGWIERVERRGSENYWQGGGAWPYFMAFGPFPAGFQVTEIRHGGHWSVKVWQYWGLVISSSGDATEANFSAGASMLKSTNHRWGQPVIYSERLYAYPLGIRLCPFKGSQTGAWYVICAIEMITTGFFYMTFGVTVERRWHEWRWAPGSAGVAGGEVERE